MLLSVIIPTFNRSHCIQRALESVAIQQMGDLEVIIGDDASTDETIPVILRILPDARIARLSVNRGAAAARNVAMKSATGEFLAFLDSDDEWLPGKLERQLQYLRDNPECAVCATGHVMCSGSGDRSDFSIKNPPEWQNWRCELHFAQSFHGASTPVVRRTVLERVGLQDEELRVLEDWDWMLRISQQYPIHVLPEMLTVIHENSPSDPDHTLQATNYFLSKHREEFLRYGAAHARRVVSQHYENAARNLFRNHRRGEGRRMLWESFLSAPLRNPFCLAAFPLALLDSIAGTNFLPEILARRSRLTHRKA